VELRHGTLSQHEQCALHEQLRRLQAAEESLAAAVLGCQAVQAELDRLSVSAHHGSRHLHPVVSDGNVLLGQSVEDRGRQRRERRSIKILVQHSDDTAEPLTNPYILHLPPSIPTASQTSQEPLSTRRDAAIVSIAGLR
jgi:hypothetical protein